VKLFFFIFLLFLARLTASSQDVKTVEAGDSIPWSYQVDTPPEFPDGESAFIFFIGKNTSIPDSLKCTINKIYITFIVDDKGKLRDTQIKIPETRIHCDNTSNTALAKSYLIETLLTALKNTPDWTPGKKGDKVVAVKMFFPINIDM
jgi:hypothetical protein